MLSCYYAEFNTNSKTGVAKMLPKQVHDLVACFAGFLLCSAIAGAEEKGLEDLDKAVEIKLFASSSQDLNRVIELCESAISKGLNEENVKYAKTIASSTSFQFASMLSEAIFELDQPDRRWPIVRAQALTKLEKAVEYNEQFGEAYYLIARLQKLPGGDEEKAEAALAKAIELAMGDGQLMSKTLVLRADAQEDNEKKLADLNEAVRLDPNNKDALRKRGLYFLDNNEAEKATADFTKLLGEDGENIDAHHALAEAYTFQEKYEKALEHIDKAIKLNPESSVTLTLRARIHMMKNDMKSAMDDLNEALKLTPRNLPALLTRARLHQLLGDLESAKEDVERVLLFQPGLTQGVLLHSIISAASGDFATAAANLERLLEKDPKNVPWRLQMAAFYGADQRPRKAIIVYTEVLSDDPRNIAALRGRADSLLSIAKQSEAVTDYEELLKIDPEHSGALNNLAWIFATSTQDDMRDGRRSIELGLKACEVTEYKEAHILSTLAAGYAESGDFETAVKWSSKAVELGEGEMKVQLEEELDSYKNKKPWREKQEVAEKPEPTRGGGDFEL